MAETTESVTATVRQIRRVTRKKYSAEEKVRIVLERSRLNRADTSRAEAKISASLGVGAIGDPRCPLASLAALSGQERVPGFSPRLKAEG
jgi:hypothetical protein